MSPTHSQPFIILVYLLVSLLTRKWCLYIYTSPLKTHHCVKIHFMGFIRAEALLKSIPKFVFSITCIYVTLYGLYCFYPFLYNYCVQTRNTDAVIYLDLFGGWCRSNFIYIYMKSGKVVGELALFIYYNLSMFAHDCCLVINTIFEPEVLWQVSQSKVLYITSRLTWCTSIFIVVLAHYLVYILCIGYIKWANWLAKRLF
jgi:hypothetical protein